MIQCPQCKGKGTITITSVEVTSTGSKYLPDMDLDCPTCGGEKWVSQETFEEFQDMLNIWCTCGNPSGETRFWRTPNGSHGYDCCDCGKVVQLG